VPALCRLYSRECGLHPDLAALVDRMLQIVPANRISLKAVAACPWLCQHDENISGACGSDASKSGEHSPVDGTGAGAAGLHGGGGGGAAAQVTRLSRAANTGVPMRPPSPLSAMLSRPRFVGRDGWGREHGPPGHLARVGQFSDPTTPPPAPDLFSTLGRRALRSSLPDSLPSSIRDSLRMTTGSEHSSATATNTAPTPPPWPPAALPASPARSAPDTPLASSRHAPPGRTSSIPGRTSSIPGRTIFGRVSPGRPRRSAPGRAWPGRLPSSPLAVLPSAPLRRGSLPSSPHTTCGDTVRRPPFPPRPAAQRASSDTCPETPTATDASSVPNSSSDASPDASPRGTRPDASLDASRDPVDASMDVSADASMDASPDASQGATVDASAGTSPDGSLHT
jgi:hypothetical protein